jgi:hypothetical protein
MNVIGHHCGRLHLHALTGLPKICTRDTQPQNGTGRLPPRSMKGQLIGPVMMTRGNGQWGMRDAELREERKSSYQDNDLQSRRGVAIDVVQIHCTLWKAERVLKLFLVLTKVCRRRNNGCRLRWRTSRLELEECAASLPLDCREPDATRKGIESDKTHVTRRRDDLDRRNRKYF